MNTCKNALDEVLRATVEFETARYEATTTEVLDRLACEAEEHLHPDIDGRRRAAQDLLRELHRTMLYAKEGEPTYSTVAQADGTLVVGGAVRVRVGKHGAITITGALGSRLSPPDLKFNVCTKRWEYGRDRSRPALYGVLDVILPVIFAAARARGVGAAQDQGTKRTQFRRGSLRDPRVGRM